MNLLNHHHNEGVEPHQKNLDNADILLQGLTLNKNLFKPTCQNV